MDDTTYVILRLVASIAYGAYTAAILKDVWDWADKRIREKEKE